MMNHMLYQNRHVLVIGLGLSGQAAGRFLLNRGAIVTGLDQQAHVLIKNQQIQHLQQSGMKIVQCDHDVDFEQIDLVILSPGISVLHPAVQKADQLKIEVIGEIELGCRSTTQSILGITGTNGKTTVTLLVNHVLNACGMPAKALGNVGIPLTQEIDQNSDQNQTLVLELSSYQLETMQQKVLDAGLILNITPDHLDRYQTIDDYAQAKSRLQQCLKLSKPLFIQSEIKKTYPDLFTADFIYTFGYTTDSLVYSDLKFVYYQGKISFELPLDLQGQKSHEIENLLGAYALCTEKGISGSCFKKAYETFQKPPHRIQFIRDFQGVRYYDDSKGTNIDAVIKAVQVLNGPIVLIAGGMHKGLIYRDWIPYFKNKVKCILVIGQAAHQIQQELQATIPVELCISLESAVVRAAELANEGDNVLLSPGCASQDMFRDYVHRGQVFQKTVQSLVNEERIKNV